MGAFIDQTGKRFGNITVLKKDIELSKKKKRIYWVCQCDCSRIKSIRGDSLKRIKTCGECANDLSGQIFGRLTVIEKSKVDSNGHQYWICQCSCGKKTEVGADNLKRGLTKSCGCLHLELNHQRTFKDITNQRFGKLTAKDYIIKQNKTYWICECDCGNTCIITRNNLLSGHTQSCGCINYSIGEIKIAEILNNNNIVFKKEYSPKDLRPLRFDFYLPEYNRLIEFDGIQHFKNSTGVWKQTQEEWEASLKRDNIKNEYAFNNNISLVRIPYWERDKITLEMLLGNQYLINMEEAEEEFNNADN